jgi:hypothetical protein
MSVLTRTFRPFVGLELEARVLLVTTCLAAALIACLLATSHVVLAGVVAVAPLSTLLAARLGTVVAAIRPPLRTVGTIWILLFASTFVWRGRTTQALDSNPLDRAALIRVGLVVVGGLIATVVLCSRRLARPRIPVSLRLFGVYIGVAYVAALGSPLHMQAAYRSSSASDSSRSLLPSPCSVARRGWRSSS